MGETNGKSPPGLRLERAMKDDDRRIKRLFADNLARLMAEAGYSSNLSLMLASGVNNATIGRYLGAKQEVGITNLIRLSRALGAPVEELVQDPRAASTARASKASAEPPPQRLVPQDLDSARPPRRASRRKRAAG
jgi:transcriptional regulator with XRE-family HTH domain